eukprot:scaffold1091_cov164-Ochromonas_danica.AAC.15
MGSRQRPRLEIIHPSNGQVLENGNLKIEIRLEGYEAPGSFHDSKICIGIATNLAQDFAEKCFQQNEVVFHADGLAAGTQYALRVVLMERNNAIAVSVRHFRVGGIAALPSQAALDMVTMRSAVQVAVQYHNSGLEDQAENIYRSILNENPTHADALHLLGILFYKKNDLLSAAEYVERALLHVPPAQGQPYHSTLGACYKRLGRIEEALEQFEKGLALNPNDPVAHFNLGLALQELGRWEDAAQHYHNATQISSAITSTLSNASGESSGLDQNRQVQPLSPEAFEQAKVRECDLLQAVLRYYEARTCLEEAAQLFPHSSTIFYELGNLLATLGQIEQALTSFRSALALGKQSAEVSIAFMLEQMGHVEESRQTMDKAITVAFDRQLPTFYLQVRRATIIHRIMPSGSDLQLLRNLHAQALISLLNSEGREVDNSSPIHMTYYLGYNYIFHDLGSNKELRHLLYQVYVSLCPALRQGYFIESSEAMQAEANRLQSPLDDLNSTLLGQQQQELSYVNNILSNTTSAMAAFSSSLPTTSIVRENNGLVSAGAIELLCGRSRDPEVMALLQDIETHVIFVEGGEKSVFYDSIQRRLLEATSHTHILQNHNNLGKSIAYLRSLQLDVLIFPEISLDPLTYFMSYARIAPVQAAMLGHPDTTGIPTVDYFISSLEAEVADADNDYSESLIRFHNFGTYFIDLYRSQAQTMLFCQYRIMELRSQYLASWNLPPNAHLYVIGHSAAKIHPDFDQAVKLILQRDHLGYVLFCDSAQPRLSWQELLVERILSIFPEDGRQEIKRHILFPNISNPLEMMQVIEISHVVLEPFPITGSLVSALEALTMGVPVVTLPAKRSVAGRLVLGLYELIHYGVAKTMSELSPGEGSGEDDVLGRWVAPDENCNNSILSQWRALDTSLYSPLVVTSLLDYVNTALKIAHMPYLRDFHSYQLLKRRHRFFHPDSPVEMVRAWKNFLFEAVQNHTSNELTLATKISMN